MSLFGRQVILDLAPPSGRGQRYRGLRVGFSVKMSLTSSPNEGTIKVYNLTGDTVAQVQEAGAIVRLSVGYDVPLLIFEGNPVAGGVVESRQGPDRILSIEAQDGGTAYKTTSINVSLSTPTSLRQAFNLAAQALGLPLGRIDFDDDPAAFPLGLTMTGPARQSLDKLAAMAGAKWTIRDGSLVVVKDGSTSGESAVVFSSTSGNLIGAPSLKDGGNVEITGLISPSMRPGKPFRVVSAFSGSGDYVAEDVEFTGDSGFDRPFYVKIVGRPL